MNRRGFLKSLGALGAAACVAPSLFTTTAPVATGFQQIYFKGRPLKFDKYTPSNQIYFLARNGPHVLRDGRITRLSM